MKENNDQMMDFDVLTTKSNGHMETQLIYKRMALPKDSVDVDGLTLTLTDKRTHGNVGSVYPPASTLIRQRQNRYSHCLDMMCIFQCARRQTSALIFLKSDKSRQLNSNDQLFGLKLM